MKTTVQGNIGLGHAIAYFTSRRWTVSIPLNDSQKYDLLVDAGTKIYKVQVKTSRQVKPSGNFEVYIRQNGRYTSVPFDKAASDLLFVLCSDGSQYLIPCSSLKSGARITIGPGSEFLIGEDERTGSFARL